MNEIPIKNNWLLLHVKDGRAGLRIIYNNKKMPKMAWYLKLNFLIALKKINGGQFYKKTRLLETCFKIAVRHKLLTHNNIRL